MKNLFSFLILAVLLTSCSEQDLSNYVADNILYNLNLSSESVIASPIDEDHTIKINTNTDWSAQTSDEWIVLENDNGASNGELRFETKANPLAETREGKIGIYCFGKHKKDIFVRQSNVSLSLNEEYLEFGSNESFGEISFETIGTWKVSSPDEWISISQKEGFGNSSIEIIIDELMSCKERIGTIIITDQSSQNKEIKVLQAGKYLQIDKNFLSFLASGENKEPIKFETDGDVEFSMDSWITCSQESKNKLCLQVQKNDSGQSKKGVLTISLKGVKDLQPIIVDIYQAPILQVADQVDLGLSIKWASFNIGASTQYGIGDHYKYGEGPDFKYDWFDIPYNILPDCLTETIFDTANAYWGGHWRIPNKNEWQELYDNCSVERIDLPKHKTINLYNEKTDKSDSLVISTAFKFTSYNGNFIILPCAGHWYYYDGPNQLNSTGIYAWNGCSYHTSTMRHGMGMSLQDGPTWFSNDPFWYNSVRAVWEE